MMGESDHSAKPSPTHPKDSQDYVVAMYEKDGMLPEPLFHEPDESWSHRLEVFPCHQGRKKSIDGIQFIQYLSIYLSI